MESSEPDTDKPMTNETVTSRPLDSVSTASCTSREVNKVSTATISDNSFADEMDTSDGLGLSIGTAKKSVRRRSSADSNCRVVSDREKRQLSLDINRLPGPMLGNIVKIIASREPSFDGTTDEVQIDFDTLKNSTLLDLQEYIVTSVEPLRQVRSQDDVSSGRSSVSSRSRSSSSCSYSNSSSNFSDESDLNEPSRRQRNN